MPQDNNSWLLLNKKRNDSIAFQPLKLDEAPKVDNISRYSTVNDQ